MDSSTTVSCKPNALRSPVFAKTGGKAAAKLAIHQAKRDRGRRLDSRDIAIAPDGGAC